MSRSLLALIFNLILVGLVHATNVTVAISGSGSCTTSNASPGSGVAFTLTASSGTVLVNVYADTSTDIGRITLTGSGNVDLFIGQSGSFPTNPNSSFSTPLARDWYGLDLSSYSGTVRVAGLIDRDLTDSVTATQIYRLQVRHDIEAIVTAIGVDNAGDSTRAVGPVIVGRSITSDGQIVASASPGTGETVTIRHVETGSITSGSDMAGVISCSAGTILAVVAAEDLSGHVLGSLLGDSGSPGDSDAVTATNISGEITMTGHVYGNIVAEGFTGDATVEVGGDLMASVVATAGDITSVSVTGSVLGYNAGPVEIIASGAIGSINVDGSITTDGDGGIVIDAPGGIGVIDCDNLTFAHIGPQAFGTGHPGIALGSMDVLGDVTASIIHLSTLTSIDIHGSVYSEVIFDTYPTRIVTDDLPSTSRIRIGGHLTTDTSIETEPVDSSPAGGTEEP